MGQPAPAARGPNFDPCRLPARPLADRWANRLSAGLGYERLAALDLHASPEPGDVHSFMAPDRDLFAIFPAVFRVLKPPVSWHTHCLFAGQARCFQRWLTEVSP